MACLLATACYACGTQTLTKAEFVSKGDQLCRRFQRRAQGVQPKNDPFQPGATPEDLQAAPRFLDFFAINLPQLAGDLRGLSPPPENRAILERTLRTLNASGVQFAGAKQSLQAGDYPAAKARVDRAYGQLEQAARWAQEYGFQACGSPAPPESVSNAAPPGPEIPVTATEYTFAMPPEVAPGPHTFVIRNDGAERHYLALVKLKEGIGVQRLIDSQTVGEPINELVEQNLGRSRAVLPGSTEKFHADLPPGNYAYACFIAAPDGQLHAFKGMAGQLLVKQP